MVIQESGEDYLETILTLYRKQGYVRSTDIANALDYTKASISRAMKILKENDFIYMDANKMIFLTEKGEKKALEIYERHQVLRRFLTEILHVDAETAESDACRIEHVVSDITFEGIKKLTEAGQVL